MPLMNMDKVFIKLNEHKTEVFEDYSLTTHSFEILTKGWAVTLKGAQNLEGPTGFIAAFELAERTSGTLCCWKVHDRILWDVVQICETEADAEHWAKRMEQMFIYQIETGRLKWLV